jgi:hypothetical protein
MRVVDGSSCESLPAALAMTRRLHGTAATPSMRSTAGIHAFDWHAGGLNGFRRHGYLERQGVRWLGQLEKYKARPLPRSTKRPRGCRPECQRAPAGVIHGDYKATT